MILENVYNIAEPKLKNKKIEKVCIGLELLGVKLTDGSLGLSYVLKDDFGKGCAALKEAGTLDKMNADKMGLWAFNEKNLIKRSLGLAVLNATAHYFEPQNSKSNVDAARSFELKADNTVGMIGYMEPLVKTVQDKGCHLIAFDRSRKTGGNIYSENLQPQKLPECNVVFISGTTLINNTLEKILSYCQNSREIILVGASTPLYYDVFSNTGVTCLSGMKWPQKNSEYVLNLISQAAGLRHLVKYGQKISINI